MRPETPSAEFLIRLFNQIPRPVRAALYKHVRWLLRQRMRGKAVTYAHGPQAGIASGFDIDVRVPDDRRLFRPYAVFFQQIACAFGVGLLGGETLPP